jgi:hypothetical protein
MGLRIGKSWQVRWGWWPETGDLTPETWVTKVTGESTSLAK